MEEASESVAQRKVQTLEGLVSDLTEAPQERLALLVISNFGKVVVRVDPCRLNRHRRPTT
jgi:NADPH-dependent curcumin reductase CurA